MANLLRGLVGAFLLILTSTVLTSQVSAEQMHRLALQISDKDPQKMNTVLIVAFNLGLHMLREDTSPVKERLSSFAQGMPNVTFHACNNTLEGMTKKEGKKPPLVTNAEIVPAGVVTLMELSEAGWTIIRP
jgi:intracellular sulfur oxidation DsrE/DsrF family protein